MHPATRKPSTENGTLPLPADNYEVRGEIRQDRANQAVFLETGTTFSKSLTTYAVQVLYKF